MKGKHVAALVISLICTLVAIALVITVAALFIEYRGTDMSDLEGEGALPGTALIGLLALFRISVSLIVIGAINALLSAFLAASLVRKYSKKTDILCFSVIGADSVIALFFIVALAVILI